MLVASSFPLRCEGLRNAVESRERFLELPRRVPLSASERVIELAGELSPKALARLPVRLAAAVTLSARVVLDLSATRRLDSRLLCAIVAADKGARAAGHHL